MKIALEDVEDLRRIIGDFRLYFNYYVIDSVSGSVLIDDAGNRKVNGKAVHGSWEVPVFIIRSHLDLDVSFPRIHELRVLKPDYFISIFVDKRLDYLRRFLSNRSLNLLSDRVYANRLFVEYLDKTPDYSKFEQFVESI